MNMKTTVIAAAVAAALGFAGSASAAGYETYADALGPVAPGNSVNFGNTITFAGVGGFQDFFTFTVAGATGSSATADVIASFNFVLPAGIVNQVSFTGFTLYQGAVAPYASKTEAGLAGAPGAFIAGGVPVNSAPDSWALAANVAGNTTYTLEVDGKADVPLGSYGGTLAIAAIPEPGEWAMMLAGLGIMGSMVRRRSRNV
jgi:uncharacterized membrane protein